MGRTPPWTPWGAALVPGGWGEDGGEGDRGGGEDTLRRADSGLLAPRCRVNCLADWALAVGPRLGDGLRWPGCVAGELAPNVIRFSTPRASNLPQGKKRALVFGRLLP